MVIEGANKASSRDFCNDSLRKDKFLRTNKPMLQNGTLRRSVRRARLPFSELTDVKSRSWDSESRNLKGCEHLYLSLIHL